MSALNKIHISHLLDMGDAELTNWLIENISEYDLVKRSELAQHDKQVKIDVLEDLIEQSTFRGLRNTIHPEELDEYIKQLKGK